MHKVSLRFLFTLICVAAWLASADAAATAGDHEAVPGQTDRSDNKVQRRIVKGHYPMLLYATYYGGSNDDRALDLVCGADCNIYICGYSQSPDFPIEGGVDAIFEGGQEGFVLKLSPDGDSVEYCTYLGGEGTDLAASLIAMPDGSVYVGGRTTSSDFPATSGAYDEEHNGGDDGFVTHLSPSGDEVTSSTFIGAPNLDVVLGVELDPFGEIVAAGRTSSPAFPIVLPTYDESHNGLEDAFVVKFSNSLDALTYSTFIGGNSEENARGLEVDAAGNIYAVGWTTSSDFPTTEEAFDQDHNGEQDFYMLKLSAQGEALLYSTFVGGRDDEDIWTSNSTAMIIDDQGDAYITGRVWSDDYPTTENAYDRTHNGSADAVLTELSPDGDSLIYSTFLGNMVSGGHDEGSAIATTIEGYVILGGRTSSAQFPLKHEIDNTIVGYEAFITEFDPTSDSLIFSTVLGGSSDDRVYAMDFDCEGNLWVAIRTSSSDCRTSPDAIDPNHNGSYDLYIVRISLHICGDANSSGACDIDDVVYLINFIFSGGPPPEPYESGDADCSGLVDIDDVVYMIAYIFSGGNAPCDLDGDSWPDC